MTLSSGSAFCIKSGSCKKHFFSSAHVNQSGAFSYIQWRAIIYAEGAFLGKCHSVIWAREWDVEEKFDRIYLLILFPEKKAQKKLYFSEKRSNWIPLFCKSLPRKDQSNRARNASAIARYSMITTSLRCLKFTCQVNRLKENVMWICREHHSLCEIKQYRGKFFKKP